VREAAKAHLRSCLEKSGLRWEIGAPIAISFLYDEGGAFGAKVAEYQVLQDMDTEETQRYINFILDRKSSVEQDLRNLFVSLQRQRHMVFATAQEIPVSLLSATLTDLFKAVYPNYIPFPFDGFSTASGNAATDCALFTRELFLGHMDRDWIAARPAKQKNRAVEVLNNSWGALDSAGAIRLLPANQSVRRVIKILETQLTLHSGPQSLNLGEALRMLCAPPYGCSIASAGLLLALFAGGRKGKLDLMRGGQSVSTETWLQSALPRNYFEQSVLNDTFVVQVSGVTMDEWSRLLNAWEIEATHSGKIEYRQKADELVKRLPVPQSLYYQYENLCLRADQAQRHLNDYGRKLDEALKKVLSGTEARDVGRLSWGAAELSGLRAILSMQSEQWTEEQLRKVEVHEAKARIEVQKRFAEWLRHQTVAGIAELPQFLRNMSRVAENLATLGLDEEKAALEQHRDQIEQHIRYLDSVRQLLADIDTLARVNKASASTSMRTIKTWLDQAAIYDKKLAEAKERGVEMPRNGLEDAAAKLAQFNQTCAEHREQLKARALQVYNAEIRTLNDIRDLYQEVTALRQLFDGQEQDVSDFESIRLQLEILESSYRQLDSNDLSDSEFDALIKERIAATEAEFGSEGPPLDNEASYQGIAQTIRARRRRAANDWLKNNLPEEEALLRATAEDILEVRGRLQNAPRLLEADQLKAVKAAIDTCNQRLDSLEVDGLVAKYQVLSDNSKRTFLRRIGVLSEA